MTEHDSPDESAEHSQRADPPTVTVGPSMIETVLEELGFGVGADGYVTDGEGGRAESIGGREVPIDECAGIVAVDGEPVLVRDDFNEIVEAAKHQAGPA